MTSTLVSETSHFPLWLEKPYQDLVDRLVQRQLPSGILISGAEQVGKGWLARRVMQRSACTAPGKDQAPCGECNGCRSALADHHPDLYFLTPEEIGKDIRVDQVRSACDFVMLGSARTVRLVLIEPADAMTLQAANALLKTLEEPPPGVSILLVSARAAQLPATVRSRCQMIRIPPPEPDVVQQWLGEGRAATAAGLSRIEALEASLGRPLEAQALLVEEMHAEKWRQDRDALRLLLRESSPFSVITAFSKCDLTGFLPRLQRLLLSAQRLLATGQVDTYGALIDADGLNRFAARLGPKRLARIARMSLGWQRDLKAPLNPQSRIEQIVLTFWNVVP
jgi:DNA polymerase-3 subunit delta'